MVLPRQNLMFTKKKKKKNHVYYYFFFFFFFWFFFFGAKFPQINGIYERAESRQNYPLSHGRSQKKKKKKGHAGFSPAMAKFYFRGLGC